jgi:hypothetical protein
MEYGTIDEETILRRLLFKEKADLHSLAQKCIELEKTDYAKIRPSQRDELIAALQEDLNSLEQFTEKQAVLHDMHLKEIRSHQEKQSILKLQVDECLEEIRKLKQENEEEKNKRSNLLEYEKQAKEINTLPKKDLSSLEISKIDNEISSIRSKRQSKELHIQEIEISGQEVITKIKEMIKNVEDLTSF